MALALGPLIGGALTQAVGWRSIFWINVPIGCAAVALAARFVPESKALRARAFDPAGQLLVFVGLAPITNQSTTDYFWNELAGEKWMLGFRTAVPGHDL